MDPGPHRFGEFMFWLESHIDESWDHTANLLALTYALNRGEDMPVLEPEHFHPLKAESMPSNDIESAEELFALL